MNQDSISEMAGLFIHLKQSVIKRVVTLRPAVCELFGLRLQFLGPLLGIFAWLSVSLVALAASGTNEKPEFSGCFRFDASP